MASRDWDSLDVEQQFLIVTSDIEELLKEINLLTTEGGEVDVAVSNALDSFEPILTSFNINKSLLQNINISTELHQQSGTVQIQKSPEKNLEDENLSLRMGRINLERERNKKRHENEGRKNVHEGGNMREVSETLDSFVTVLTAQLEPQQGTSQSKGPNKKQTEAENMEEEQEKHQDSKKSRRSGVGNEKERKYRTSTTRESREKSKVSLKQTQASTSVVEEFVQPGPSRASTRPSRRAKTNTPQSASRAQEEEEEEESVYESLTHYNLRRQTTIDYSETY